VWQWHLAFTSLRDDSNAWCQPSPRLSSEVALAAQSQLPQEFLSRCRRDFAHQPPKLNLVWRLALALTVKSDGGRCGPTDGEGEEEDHL
jgi:hypothetical protein